jgi:hypothetical protein
MMEIDVLVSLTLMQVDVLVNNAGFDLFGDHLAAEQSRGELVAADAGDLAAPTASPLQAALHAVVRIDDTPRRFDTGRRRAIGDAAYLAMVETPKVPTTTASRSPPAAPTRDSASRPPSLVPARKGPGDRADHAELRARRGAQAGLSRPGSPTTARPSGSGATT